MPDTPAPSMSEWRKAYADGFNQSLTLRSLGVEMSFPEDARRVVATLHVKPYHLGGMGAAGVVNGGVLACLFDLVIGCTGALVDPRRRSATVQLSMTFERPTKGEVITGEGWIDRAGSSMLFSSAVIKDAQGEVCARCQGVVRMSQSMQWEDLSSPAV